jgi:hypothetical protein
LKQHSGLRTAPGFEKLRCGDARAHSRLIMGHDYGCHGAGGADAALEEWPADA